jgi:hypothetical protein
MISWFAANWGTLLISIVLLIIVALIIVKLRKDKKQGKSSCGGGCAHCAMGGSCHRK